MLLPDNIKPENSIYYNGAIVLGELQKFKRVEFLDLYEKVIKEKEMSFPVYILCLDWLYLIDAAKKEGEEVVICS